MELRTPLTVSPFMYIGDSTGRPLDYGRVYFGEPNKDPEFYPIDIYSDEDMTKPLAQPIRTKGGFMHGNGDMVEAHAAEVQYSVKVLDQYGRKVLYKGVMYRNNVSDFLVDEIERATTAEDLIATSVTTEKNRALAAEKVIADAVVTEKDRAVAVEGAIDAKAVALAAKDIELGQQITSLAGGRKSYKTYAEMVAKKAEITANSIVDITNDTAENNGAYNYDGTTFTKSAYDPLTQSKTYTDTAKSSAISTAATDATAKANTAKSEAIAAAIMHSNTNKIDLVDISYTYTNGNMIGTKTPKYTNLGISGGIVAIDSVDSLVLRVDAGDVLYMHNITQKYTSALGSRFSFFASDPNTNRTQTAVAHTAVTETDSTSGIIYQKVTVPPTAKYLMINTRTVAAGTTYNMSWAVHKGKFNASFTAGTEVVYKIKDIPLIGTDDYLRAATYTDAKLQDYEKLKISTKNLYNGTYTSATKTNKLGVFASANAGDSVTQFIPVTAGQSYTISGLDMSLQVPNGKLIVAFTGTSQATFVKYLTYLDDSGTTTVLIDDPTIKYIVVPITSGGLGTVAQAAAMPLQIEHGATATSYEPYLYSLVAAKMLAGFSPSNGNSAASAATIMISKFVEMNKVRNSEVSTLESVRKDIGSTGLRYIVSGSSTVDSSSNNIFTQTQINSGGTRSVSVHLMKTIDGVKTLGDLKATPFTVPSGQFDNPDTLSNYADTYPLYSYVHPSIAYNATGIGGFKYWMMASTLPAGNMGDSTWEDEDVFVSNDAKTWQRVRSLYEDAKDYTTATLRLPPHNLVKTNARKNAFLPCPSVGDTIEISVPANNGAPALERTNITLVALPWKHDPFIMFDGGYLYAYVSYHLPYVDRDSGKNRFIVCVRTANGVDWDVVRSDGSTMRLTETSSRTIFTKDEQGRYNYLAYFYNYGGSNPEVIKYGEGDYEFIYGNNFSRRYKGTAPYAFNFTDILPMQDVGSFNHPTLLLNAGTLYLLNHKALYASTDRGVTFTQYAKNPTWVGGVASIDYKKALCIGTGGKLMYVDTQRIVSANTLGIQGGFTTSNNINLLTTYEYPSVADFVSKATNGLVDAYIDVQLIVSNQAAKTRSVHFYPAVSLNSMSASVNLPMQRITIDTIDFQAGDLLTFYVTLNSRNGAEIQFGGIDIT